MEEAEGGGLDQSECSISRWSSRSSRWSSSDCHLDEEGHVADLETSTLSQWLQL